MSAAPAASRLFVPPYPRRPDRPRGSLSTLLALQRNPIEIWCEADFERPVSVGRTIFGLRGAAHDPAAVRRIFLDNAANYRKDDLQLRILRPGLGNGLLTAEGEDWRIQRRALAPLFSPRQVEEFAPAVHRVGWAGVERMARRRDGAVADVGAVMSRLTLEVLEQTLFSQGLGREPSAFRRAVTSYFETIGRLDPLDLLNVPAFVPRLRRRRGRGALEFFEFGRRRDHRKATGAARPGGQGPTRSPDSPPVGEGSREWSGHIRRGCASQHCHLHQRGPRDHRQCLDLDAFPALPIARMARAGGDGDGSGVRRRRVSRDGKVRNPSSRLRGSAAPLSPGGDAFSPRDRG